MSEPPLLDLDTLIVRPTIKIDDKNYEILSPNELSIIDSQRFTLWGALIETLAPDEAKGEELTAVVDKAARMVFVGAPEAVFAKLSGAQKMQVVEVFTMLLLRGKMGAAGAMLTEMVKKRPTGAK